MQATDENFFNQVKKVIEKDIRPFIEADGGRIQLKKVSNGVVYITLSGACSGCPGAVITLREGVERVLKIKVKDVKAVKLVY